MFAYRFPKELVKEAGKSGDKFGFGFEEQVIHKTNKVCAIHLAGQDRPSSPLRRP